MTEYEEPAAKMSKLEIPTKDQEEEMDEGQEEWLSEGILTDDDFNPATDQDKSDVNVSASQDDTTPSIPDEDVQDDSHHHADTHDNDNKQARETSVTPDNLEELINSHTQESIAQENDNSDSQVNETVQDNTTVDDLYEQQQGAVKHTEQTMNANIEETLDNFENSQQTDLPDELGVFLVKKPNKKTEVEEKKDSDMDASTKNSDDDGNDTDELLRMLGDSSGQKNKKEVKKVNRTEQKKNRVPDSQSSDDDEYIFDGTKVARLKVAKNVIMKKYPTKAVPENMSDREDDTDGSSDEGLTMKKIFVSRKGGNFAAKSTTKPPTRDSVVKKQFAHNTASKKRPVTSTPLQKSQTKPEVTFTRIRGNYQKEAAKKVPEPQRVKAVSKGPFKVKLDPKPVVEPDEIIDEEEFLEEEDEFDLDEDFQSDHEARKGGGQRIMRPEQMDEEVPTDGDTHSEGDNDSLYDEFPSSGSDQEEWFTLDVRSERASDYIPLLGSKAHPLLTTEKKRVAARVQTLRKDLSNLNQKSQKQADMLRRATLQLAELDAALKA